MSDQSNTPGTGSASSNVADTGSAAAAQDGQPNPQDGGEAWIKWNNKKELQDTIAKTRVMERAIGEVNASVAELKSMVAKMAGGVAPPAPAPAAAAQTPHVDDSGSKALVQVEALTRKLAFEKAANAAGIKEGTPQRELLETAYEAAKPADAGEWLKKYTGAVATPPKPVIPGGSPRLGAPATPDESDRLPANPLQLPQEVLANMTPDERVAHYNAWRAKSGQGNPLSGKISEALARYRK